jgi:hypothetical protein
LITNVHGTGVPERSIHALRVGNIPLGQIYTDGVDPGFFRARVKVPAQLPFMAYNE